MKHGRSSADSVVSAFLPEDITETQIEKDSNEQKRRKSHGEYTLLRKSKGKDSVS